MTEFTAMASKTTANYKRAYFRFSGETGSHIQLVFKTDYLKAQINLKSQHF